MGWPENTVLLLGRSLVRICIFYIVNHWNNLPAALDNIVKTDAFTALARYFNLIQVLAHPVFSSFAVQFPRFEPTLIYLHPYVAFLPPCMHFMLFAAINKIRICSLACDKRT